MKNTNPPHFNPKAINADFKRSRPSDANSSQLENADSSKCAPTCVNAEPASFWTGEKLS